VLAVCHIFGGWLSPRVRAGRRSWWQTYHIRDVLRAKRQGRTGIDLLKGGLAHVDTGSKGGAGPLGWISAQVAGLFGKKSMGMQPEQPIVKDLVLIGGGHAHAYVLKNFGMNPVPGVKVTLITRDVMTPYSGMLPGHVAGFYTKEECHIDLLRLARFANVRVIHAEATGIEYDGSVRKSGRVVLKGGRPAVHFDVLAVDIGSTPTGGVGNAAVTPVKPIDGFSARWDVIMQRCLGGTRPMTIAVVGGGAGGIELTLSMQSRLRRELLARNRNPDDVRLAVLTRGKGVLTSHAQATSSIFAELLKTNNVDVLLEHEVDRVENGHLVCTNGSRVAFDECVWCTQAGGAEWLKGTALDLDDNGFIRVNETLESVNCPGIFAAGDIACLPTPRPKAGVFAVRAGPPLTANLRKFLAGAPPAEYEPFIPQSTFLGIIGTGSTDLAVASKGPMALQGAWVWDLKDWIDRKWMAGYTHDLPVMAAEEVTPSQVTSAAGPDALAALAHASMRCGGCGAKVGATVLSNVMKRIKDMDIVVNRKEVLVGLDSPDDCAVVAPEPDMAIVQTVDFFRSFIDDPYVFGKIAANHALSDCHAMCAEARTALAIAVVPFAIEAKVEETLFQMMAGACEMLKESDCALVGGHTCEGTELALGFCITGAVDPKLVKQKKGMQPGEVLILTKAVGTGTLFAAEMRMKAHAPWITTAIESMVLSNRKAALCLQQHGASACTDVTGCVS